MFYYNTCYSIGIVLFIHVCDVILFIRDILSPDIFVAGEYGRVVFTWTQFYGNRPRGSSSIFSRSQKSAKRSQGTSLPLLKMKQKIEHLMIIQTRITYKLYFNIFFSTCL